MQSAELFLAAFGYSPGDRIRVTRREPWLRCSGGCPHLQGWRPWLPSVRSSPATGRSPGWSGETSRRCGARAAPGRAGMVTEEMLADLPEPVRRYLRYNGVVGKPFPRHHPAPPAGHDAARAGPAVGTPGRRGTLLGAPARFRVGRNGAHGPAAGGTGPRHVRRRRGAAAGQGGLAVAGGGRQRRADGPGRDDALPER